MEDNHKNPVLGKDGRDKSISSKMDVGEGTKESNKWSQNQGGSDNPGGSYGQKMSSQNSQGYGKAQSQKEGGNEGYNQKPDQESPQ